MIYWLLYIASCIAYNWHKIAIRKKRPDYKSAVKWRVFFGAVFLIANNPNLDPLGNPITLLIALPFIVWQITNWYILFDPLLALVLGRPRWWDYQGKDSGTFFDKLPKPLYYALKAVCLAVLILSTIALL